MAKLITLHKEPTRENVKALKQLITQYFKGDAARELIKRVKQCQNNRGPC